MVEKQKKLFRRHTLADAGLRPQEVVQPNPAVVGTARLGQVGILLGRTLSMIFTARTDKGESWKMAYRFTNGSLTFILISMSFVGMIMVYQSTEQMARSIGDTSLVGASFLKILVRVLGPTVIGLLIACRVGAGIAAEIGAGRAHFAGYRHFMGNGGLGGLLVGAPVRIAEHKVVASGTLAVHILRRA